MKEQYSEGLPEPQVKERGGDTDYFGKIIVPSMKQEGFKITNDENLFGKSKCPYYCCKYLYFPDHSNGVNIMLQCGDGGDPTKGAWKIQVYYGGNKGLKTFEPGDDGARQAVQYAKMLKNKMFSSK